MLGQARAADVSRTELVETTPIDECIRLSQYFADFFLAESLPFHPGLSFHECTRNPTRRWPSFRGVGQDRETLNRLIQLFLFHEYVHEDGTTSETRQLAVCGICCG